MKKTLGSLSMFLSIFLMSLNIFAQGEVEEEASGLEPSNNLDLPIPDPEAKLLALSALGVSGLLLIPESSNDRIMAFDPMTGDLIDPDFIPADPDNLSTPLNAIAGFNGDSILVSDQLEDVVQEYDLDGNYIGVFAPAGGVNTSILDNIRGIAISGDMLLVSVGSGDNADAIAAFDNSGTYIGNFINNGAGGLDSPFDVLESGGDFYVSGITSDAIHRYDNGGSFIANLAAVDNFPEQIAETANGDFLVGNFSGSQEGIVELSAAGTVLGVYNPPSLGGYRGVYELPNGNILTTNGGGVHEVDRSGTLVETKIDGVSARFISLLEPTVNCDPVSIQASIGGAITVTGTPGCVFDLYDNGCDSNSVNWVIIATSITIPDSGSIIVPNVTGSPDACYIATVAGNIDQTLNNPVRTVPTMSGWAFIGFIFALTCIAVFFSRQKRIQA